MSLCALASKSVFVPATPCHLVPLTVCCACLQVRGDIEGSVEELVASHEGQTWELVDVLFSHISVQVSKAKSRLSPLLVASRTPHLGKKTCPARLTSAPALL